MLLFLLVAVSTVWMHVAIRRMERARHPALLDERHLSDLPAQPYPAPDQKAVAGASAADGSAVQGQPAR